MCGTACIVGRITLVRLGLVCNNEVRNKDTRLVRDPDELVGRTQA